MAISSYDIMATIADLIEVLEAILNEIGKDELSSGARSELERCMSISRNILEVAHDYQAARPTIVKANQQAEDGVATD